MFTGLNAFPLTPVSATGVDQDSFARILDRLLTAGVDALGVLGSTGSYAYLDIAERRSVLRLALSRAGRTPVMVGVGALRTRDVLALAHDAEDAGASGLLIAPMSYQPLKEAEVMHLFETVCAAVRTPICVYDNPGTTRFVFTDELHARIARLPNIASIKIPGVPSDQQAANERVMRLRGVIPPHVSIGISGDPSAARGLNAGCEVWYSVVGGLFPEIALQLTRAARSGKAQAAERVSNGLEPLWRLFQRHGGSIRVIATAAFLLGLCREDSLPLPLHLLHGRDRDEVAEVLAALGLH